LRVLYIDIDSLRPDHLGCYGYQRNTSPNIDTLARQGLRFENCYITDGPCLPSRTALWSGRCGFHTGVVGHGGTAAQPFIEGPERGFRDLFFTTGWLVALRQTGMLTVAISSFGERHAAWHWYAGFNEVYNTGKRGMEQADEICDLALAWLRRHATSDNWFLHVNLWDPHMPYRTPLEFGNPFSADPLPAWLTDEVLQRSWEGFGPRSAQEPHAWDYVLPEQYPRMPAQLDSLESVRRWIDGYDVGLRYADAHIGRILAALSDAGVLDDTAIIVSADHGENLGELNIWGDHHTADAITARVPLILRWPGLTGGRVDQALHYHYDWAATLIEMVGGAVPANWDGRSFAAALRDGREAGRPFLVTSHGAWSVQRAVRFDDYICLRTYHDGYKQLAPLMLFDLRNDPHEQHDLAGARPDLTQRAMALLADWEHEMMLSSRRDVDPLMTVLREGGPFHTRGMLAPYVRRLRETGRSLHAERLIERHRDEARGL
jgi:choline-sulfatase